MAKRDDFVKLHRSILEWEWYHDDRCARLFVHLILKARFAPGKWQGVTIEAGQFPTSTVKLATELGWSRSAVVRTLEKLTETGEVNTKSDTKWTLVTLVNWAKWQGVSQKSDSKPDTNRIATGHEPDSNRTHYKKGRREEGKNVNTPIGVSERRAAFIEKCRAVVETDPARLPDAERKAFLDYWTETGANGQMRFEDQKYFDHGRRMDTWRTRAQVNPTPIAKPSNIKPWMQ